MKRPVIFRREDIPMRRRRSLEVDLIIFDKILVVIFPTVAIGKLMNTVVDRLARRSVEASSVAAHDGVLRKSPDAGPISQSAFKRAQPLVRISGVTDEPAPTNRRQIVREIDILPPPPIVLSCQNLRGLLARHRPHAFVGSANAWQTRHHDLGKHFGI